MMQTRAQDTTSESGPVTTVVGTVMADDVTAGTDVTLVDLPDTTAPPTDPIVYVVVIVLAILLVAAGVYGAHITTFLATMVPPETANSIYQSGVRFGLQMALNHAAKTPTDADDEFFKEMARQRGLEVMRLPDGTYEVKLTAQPVFSGASVPG